MRTEEIKRFRESFKTAMKELEKEFGVSVSLGNINYTDKQFTTKMVVVSLGENVNVENKGEKEKAVWNYECLKHGLKPEDYGKTTTIRGRQFKAVGFKPNARTKSLIIEELGTGKRYVTETTAVFQNHFDD